MKYKHKIWSVAPRRSSSRSWSWRWSWSWSWRWSWCVHKTYVLCGYLGAKINPVILWCVNWNCLLMKLVVVRAVDFLTSAFRRQFKHMYEFKGLRITEIREPHLKGAVFDSSDSSWFWLAVAFSCQTFLVNSLGTFAWTPFVKRLRQPLGW